jgi:AbrB family looped-hinge helix DNA binding protein
MTECEEADLTVVSGKGQVVIPAAIRAELNLKPKTKLLVYRCEDAIILKKLELPDLKKEIEAMYKRVNERIAKYGSLTQEDVEEEIQAYRREKAKHR